MWTHSLDAPGARRMEKLIYIYIYIYIYTYIIYNMCADGFRFLMAPGGREQSLFDVINIIIPCMFIFLFVHQIYIYIYTCVYVCIDIITYLKMGIPRNSGSPRGQRCIEKVQIRPGRETHR